jgi:hypothetical protein
MLTGQESDSMAKRAEFNSKFRRMVTGARTLSVQLSIKQEGNPIPGHAVFMISRPNKLYYHLTWGKDDYTFTVVNGRATEVDLGKKVYDEYAVPGLTGPAGNSSDFNSFFPAVFVREEVVLPAQSFDDSGHLKAYAIGSGAQGDKNVITFSDYKLNAPIPDSKFVPNIPAGLTAHQIPQPAPPIQIGSSLPDLRLVDNSGKPATLVQAIGGKHAIVAYLDSTCQPSVSALAALQKIKGTQVVVLDASPKGNLKTGSLPAYHDPKGSIGAAIRAPMTPLMFLVDSRGNVVNVWYGFDRRNPKKLAGQLTQALADLRG